jgi:tRNA pseudouridine synthase 10
VDLINKAREILARYPLCDSCLGRLFATLGYGLENSERGGALKTLIHMDLVSRHRNGEDVVEDLKQLAKSHKPTRRYLQSIGVNVDEEVCYICGGLLDGVESLVDTVLKKVTECDFTTYAVGTTISRDILERESEIVKKYLITTAESIKHEVNRRLGKALMRHLTGKRVDKLRPNVVFKIDLTTGEVYLVRNPILIEGRYWKLSRRVSQVKKFGSVKTTIYEKLKYLVDIFGGVDITLHIAGREDSDVRMLGNGRPVVVEIKSPASYTKTALPYEDGEIIFHPKGLTTRNEIRRLKEKSKTDIKLYRALVLSDVELTHEQLGRLAQLHGSTVVQYTPKRILRRSHRKKKRRMVYELAWRLISPHVFELYIRAQGGLYIKEFIHGDGGRTMPNVADILNTHLEVLELDVLYVE